MALSLALLMTLLGIVAAPCLMWLVKKLPNHRAEKTRRDSRGDKV
jgi:hypothetical protein